jgi:hypothetical protein
MSLSGEMFLETGRAEVLRSCAHAHVALAGIVGDEQEPYFHFASTERSIAQEFPAAIREAVVVDVSLSLRGVSSARRARLWLLL